MTARFEIQKVGVRKGILGGHEPFNKDTDYKRVYWKVYLRGGGGLAILLKTFNSEGDMRYFVENLVEATEVADYINWDLDVC